MSFAIESLAYEAAGLAMKGRLFRGPGASASALGILVFPDAFGLGGHAFAQAQRLAELGHVVLACDLHGDGALMTEIQQMLDFVAAARRDPSDLRARARGALDALVAQDAVDPEKIVTVGYCIGGTMALELARSGAPVCATIGLHAGLGTARPEDAVNIRGSVLACIGSEDPIVPPDERVAFEQEMRAGGVDWKLSVYGGVVHSFTDPAVDQLGQPHVTRYDLKAYNRSWAEICQLLEEVAAR